MRGKNWAYHLVAFMTVAVWGSTFVFTKMLLQAGLSPAQIFTLRFVIAYVLLLAYESVIHYGGSRFSASRSSLSSCPFRLSRPSRPSRPFCLSRLSHSSHPSHPSQSARHFPLFASSWRGELLMAALGLTGGSLYFLTENAAMLYTTATNTSLIVCSCPLFAMLLVAAVYSRSEHVSRVQAFGSVMACAGMGIVVLNGHFVLHLSPLGDVLAFVACLCWAVYSLLMKVATEHYSTLFITRKVFFYGLVTILPYYAMVPADCWIFTPAIVRFFSFPLLLNLLFLGVVASMLCFLVWNWVIRKLGAVVATNWVYFNPITTIIFAWWLLNERITPWFLLGTLLILTGMYLCDRK